MSQLVTQQEIRGALQTKSFTEVQRCLEKIKVYNLPKLNLAKRLEAEWVANQKVLTWETKAEISRVAAEKKRVQKKLCKRVVGTAECAFNIGHIRVWQEEIAVRRLGLGRYICLDVCQRFQGHVH